MVDEGNSKGSKTTKINTQTTENLVTELNTTLNRYTSVIYEVEKRCQGVKLGIDGTELLREVVKLGDNLLKDEERLCKGKDVKERKIASPQLILSECIPKSNHEDNYNGDQSVQPSLSYSLSSSLNDLTIMENYNNRELSCEDHPKNPPLNNNNTNYIQFRNDSGIHGSSSPPKRIETLDSDEFNNIDRSMNLLPNNNKNNDFNTSEIINQALSILYSDISKCRLTIKQIWIIAKGQLAMMSNNAYYSDHCKPPIAWDLDEDASSLTPMTPVRMNTPLNDILAMPPGAQSNYGDVCGHRKALLLEVEPKSRTPLSGIQPYGSPVDPTSMTYNSNVRPDEDIQTSFKRIIHVLHSNAKSMRWNNAWKTRAYQGIMQSQRKRSLKNWHTALLTPKAEESSPPVNHYMNSCMKMSSMSYDSISDQSRYNYEGSSKDSFLSSWSDRNELRKMRSSLMNLNRPRRGKSNAPIDYDALDPDTVGHEIWMTGESVDAPTADIYIKKYGSVPLGFDMDDHRGKSGGEIAALFKPVKGVYFVKYNAMWFAEWHDLNRVRHRTRFSVQKYGHCTARALAVEKRAAADRERNRLIIERNATLAKNNEANARYQNEKSPQKGSGNTLGQPKIGPTWTGLPDPEENHLPAKERIRKSRNSLVNEDLKYNE